MKKWLFLLSLLTFVFMSNATARADIAQGVKVIIIDAGHGGKDVGAVNGKVYEKDLNLKIALKVGSLIEKHMPGIKVVYTRKTDTYLTLQQRADVAHKSHGDLYLSIHVNSADKSAQGAETCIFSMDTNLAAVNRGGGSSDMDRAANHNRNMLTNRHSEEMVDLKNVSKDAATRAYINRMQFVLGEYSNAIAELIQRNYAKSGRVVRGVKRGPFQVLWGIDMPSALTEIGFLSNPNELQYMTSEKGQTQIAEDIYFAIAEYAGNINKALQTESRTPAASTGGATATSLSEPVATAQKPAEQKQSAEPAKTDSAQSKQSESPAQTTRSGSAGKHGFTVQIMASASQLSSDDARFKSCRGKVDCYIGEGSYKYKYCVGFYETREAARLAAAQYSDEFGGAFVIEVEDGRVLPINKI